MLSVHFTDIVDATNVGMRNLACVSYFGVKSSQSGSIVLECSGKKLEGYNIPELEILSAIDFAHAAAPQRSDDPVPLDKNRARRESPASWRARTWGSSWLGRNSIFIRFQGRRFEDGYSVSA